MSSGISGYFGFLQLQWTVRVPELRGSVWQGVWLLKARLSSRAWMSCNKYVLRSKQKDPWGPGDPNEHLISFNFWHFFFYILPFFTFNINSLSFSWFLKFFLLIFTIGPKVIDWYFGNQIEICKEYFFL